MNLNDEKFKKRPQYIYQKKMQLCAYEIYKKVFPGSSVKEVTGTEIDKEFGIDTILTLKSGSLITIQEKYRKSYSWNNFSDFTQGHTRAYKTQYQSNGEWFKNSSELYFYGWSNDEENSFAHWFLMDVLKYKILVDKCGGIEKIGYPQPNNDENGDYTLFYCIELFKLLPAMICFHNLDSGIKLWGTEEENKKSIEEFLCYKKLIGL